MKMRIQAIISSSGLCSRRAAEKLISDGRVKVNGITALTGQSADSQSDIITVDDIPLVLPDSKKYILLNKPTGVITSMSDERGRKCVSSLVSDCPARVYPVGRLDYMSQGLLIMTDDGALAYALTHPSRHADKEYTVKVRGSINPACIKKLGSGLVIDGYKTAPAKIEVIGSNQRGGIIKITIHEGRNRQVRKMCALCGLGVVTLTRTAIGSLRLPDDLAPGHWRYLTDDQIEYLKTFI